MDATATAASSEAHQPSHKALANLSVTRLDAPFGVEVHGVDLRSPIEKDVGAAIREMFFRHRVLVFRGQELEPTHQIALVRLINRVMGEARVGAEEDPALQPEEERYAWVANTDVGTFGASSAEFCWHADQMYTPQGALQALSLYGAVMEQSTPTQFADMVRAVSKLSPELRSRVANLRVVNLLIFDDQFRPERRCRMSTRPANAPNWKYPHSIHPLIERHPVTGEEFIDVSEMMTSHVEGWDDDASEQLFQELASLTYAEDNLYTHHWREHDLVLWDNIGLQHRRGAHPGAGRRILRRVAANPYELNVLNAAAAMEPWAVVSAR